MGNPDCDGRKILQKDPMEMLCDDDVNLFITGLNIGY
jgi:hypothetical protein